MRAITYMLPTGIFEDDVFFFPFGGVCSFPGGHVIIYQKMVKKHLEVLRAWLWKITGTHKEITSPSHHPSFKGII